MNRQIIIYVLIVIITFFLIFSHPIAAQNQIFPIGKLGYANVTSIAWNSDADLLAVANGLTIDLIDTVSYKRLALLTGYTQEISSVAFSPDDRWLASGSDDNTIKLWDTDNLQEIASFDQASQVSSVAFSPDGYLLATNGEVLEGVIKIWEVNAKQPVATLIGSSLPDQTRRLLAKHLVAFSPDGRLLASSAAQSHISLWNTSNWQEVGSLLEHMDLVFPIAFSPDGQLFVSSGQSSGFKL